MTLVDTYKAVAPAVVGFVSKYGRGQPGASPAAPPIFGTGFLVREDGIVATNRHVVEIFSAIPNNPQNGSQGFAAMIAEPNHRGADGELSFRMMLVEILDYYAFSGNATADGWFGEKRVHWAMMVIGLVIGLPAFFEVGFVLLIPIAFTVARRTRTSLILVGLPMVAGLSVVHGLVPPHPAALLAVTIYKADVGRTIFYALLVGIPTAVIAGPLYAKLIAPHIHLPAENPMAAEFVDHGKEQSLPGFWLTLFTILFPVILMLVGSWADGISTPKSPVNEGLHLIGNDDMAIFSGIARAAASPFVRNAAIP